MRYQNLIKRNIRYFARYYQLVAIAVLIAVAVITGSLAVGDSVRSTLVKRVNERLGNTETILFSMNSFIEETLLQAPLFHNKAEGILLSNGFIPIAGKLVPVMVWGVDNTSIPPNGAKINRALAAELRLAEDQDIVLRLPATGLVPSGSLFVTDNYTTSLRLSMEGILEVNDGGNISLKNEHTIPYNIFVNRTELAITLGIEGKVNLILSPDHITQEDLDKIWHYSLSGMHVTATPPGVEITSDRIFIPKEAAEAICLNNSRAGRLFSYLVNSIEATGKSISYSFVTAIEDPTLSEDEVILSDYAAKRLHAGIGDTLRLTYYISKDLKILSTDTLYGRVSRIIPLSVLHADSTLSAKFPGLSDVENCTDWNSDLPINMDLVTKEDEDYWDTWRNTPKAIIAYRAVANAWSNPYGSATAIRIDSTGADLSGLTPSMFGIRLIYPRENGLHAAMNGVSFSGLFLSLGFFIILSAILLMLVPLSEMLHRRKPEIALLKALGFDKKRIQKLLWTESVPAVLLASFAGVATGLLYTWLTLLLLAGAWKGATHTTGLSLLPDIGTTVAGLIAGTGISLLLLWFAIRHALKGNNSDKQKEPSGNRKRYLAIAISVVTAGLACINSTSVQSPLFFVITGVLLTITAVAWGDYLICRNGTSTGIPFKPAKLIWATFYTDRSRTLLSFVTLATGVLIVFSVGLNRKGFTDRQQIRSGTGGYTLWCESSVPIYHNLATKQGREKVALKELPADVGVMQLLRYSSDDASCLNLNKVAHPTVLGVEMDLLEKSDFEIEQCLYPKETLFKMMQTTDHGIYPALIDATVLTWGLMMNLGDTIRYKGENGEEINIRLTGTLKNSVFQGNILIDKRLFSKIWSGISGSEILLLKGSENKKDEVKTLVSQALNNYGVKVTDTADRLKEFYSVTDTYLTIFLTLGGLGLLIGIISFAIIVRKNLVARSNEIALYRTLGYTDQKIGRLLYIENIIVPLYAITAGIAGSLAGAANGIANISWQIWLIALVLTTLFIFCMLIFIRQSVRQCLKHE